jgi:hypothetical protein
MKRSKIDALQPKASLMKELIRVLFPPGVPAVTQWRLAMFAAVLALYVHVGIACGYGGRFGVPGFAAASDVVRLRQDVTAIRTENIEQQLFDTRVHQCAAQTTEPRRFYLERFQELLRRYKESTGSEYRAPECSEL